MSLTEAAAFEGVAGHSRALRLLESQLQRDHLAQAYLFTGEANLGKTEVARRLAKALLPEHPLERHPDYWEDDRGRAIPIDEIRLLPDRQPEFHAQSLQHFLSLKPAIATRRVALITSVGRLAAELDSAHLAWRNSERWGGPTPEEGMADPLLEALGSWQLELRRRLQHDSRPGPWARLLELSYDTIGYHEQNVSPRLNLECFLLECRRAS